MYIVFDLVILFVGIFYKEILVKIYIVKFIVGLFGKRKMY